MVNKHLNLIEFLKKCPQIESFLYFNTLTEEEGVNGISTTTNDYFYKKYFNGGIKYYDFAYTVVKAYDTGTSNNNSNAIDDISKIIEWVDLQNKNGNYPDFGDNANIVKIECLQSEPTFSGINEKGNLAKYMLQFRITYTVNN